VAQRAFPEAGNFGADLIVRGACALILEFNDFGDFHAASV
jgi:hypothetical protein